MILLFMKVLKVSLLSVLGQEGGDGVLQLHTGHQVAVIGCDGCRLPVVGCRLSVLEHEYLFNN